MSAPLFYIASPYSHDSESVRLYRFNRVCQAIGDLTAAGYHCYSPIAHFHPVAMQSNLPTDWSFWEEKCKVMLRACTHFAILELDGWSMSTGIRSERRYASLLGRPSFNLEVTRALAPQVQEFLSKHPYGI